jgi:tRNA (mo5U34)-methyltransferase
VTDPIARAKELEWYHTLELTPEYTTPGMFDLRPVVDLYGLPERMDGMRALDVGTWDGFWAFEMERRGADVTALDLDDMKDLDWPAIRRPEVFPDTKRGDGFRLAKELKGSQVDRVNRSVYHALPEDLGQFDVVFCGSVIIHLRDQVLALERICNLVKPGGYFLTTEAYDPIFGRLPLAIARYRAHRESSVVFWEPTIRTWRSMLSVSGFSKIEQLRRFKLKATAGYNVPHVVHKATR